MHFIPRDDEDDSTALLIALSALLRQQFPSLAHAANAAERRMAELEATPSSSRIDQDDVELFFLHNCLEKYSDVVEEAAVGLLDGKLYVQ